MVFHRTIHELSVGIHILSVYQVMLQGLNRRLRNVTELNIQFQTHLKFTVQAYPRRVHYPIAKDLCAKENSTLVSIHSDFENDFVIRE